MGLFRRFASSKFLSLTIVSLLLANFSFSVVTIEPVLGSPGLTLKWKTGLGVNGSTLVGPLAADVNHDGKMEIVVTGGSSQGADNGSVTVLDGNTGNVDWQVAPGGVGQKTPFEIADINNDGNLEIFVSGNYPVVLNGSDGSIIWKNTAVSSYNLWSAICDINADGYSEIFVSSGRGPTQGYDYFTTLSYDGKILLQNNTSWHPCWGGMTIGDPNSNGSFILYQGDRCLGYRTSPTPEEPYINGGWGLRALDAATLTTLWNDSSITCSSHPPILADVDKDGILDVIATNQGTSSGGLIVLNASNGVVSTAGGKYRKDLSLPGGGLPSHSEPTVYDIDGDGNLEIIACRDTNPKIWDLYDWKLDAVLPIVCNEPPKVGDINGDGKMEIIAPSGNSIYIYEYNSSSMNYDQVDLIKGLNSPRPFTLVQDVDGDGLNELIVTSSSGIVYCYHTSAPAPTPRVRSGLSFYSERHCGAAEYVPPSGPPAPMISEPSPSDGATNVAVSLSQLTFKLFDYQRDPISYTVTTNPNIGSGSQPNVPNGRYSIPISGLAYATTYNWTVTATDGIHANTKTFTFTTSDLPPWYSTDWQYRRQIVIDHTKVSGTQTNFPVVIDLTDSDLKKKAQPNGYDFLFTDQNQNKLSHEIELYNNTAGHLITWVNVPSISSATDTILYMYYGNPTCGNQQNTTGVWDLSNKMVLHLDEKTGTRYDSTINGNNATPYNGVSQGVTGEIDGSDTFDGVSGYLQIPHNDTLTGFTQSFTASFWLRLDNVTKKQRILNKNDGAVGQKSWYIEYQTNLLGFFASQDGNTYKEWHASITPVAGAWYYVAVVWQNGTVPIFYLNGARLVTSGMSTLSSINNNVGAPLYMGRCPYNAAIYLTGGMDEVRISNPARSADWILSSYNNQKNPSTFYAIGTEEGLPGEPQISYPDPPEDSTNVAVTLTELSFNLTDYQRDLMTYCVSTAPDIGDGNTSNVNNGRYFVPISGLGYSTTYVWQVNVTDGTNWTNKTYTFTTQARPNTAPIASNLQITPTDPKTNDDLVGSYSYYDQEGDPESGTQIRWYRNSTLVPTLNDTLTVPSSLTYEGDNWYFTVIPKDGLIYGTLVQSPTVTVLNTPPQIDSVTISPKPAYTNDTLTATPNGWSDPDQDPEGYVYQWQKWSGTEWQNITGATSQTLAPSSFANGDQIRVMCTPYDGKDYGGTKNDTVTIKNRAPTINSYTPAVDYPCINTTQQQTFAVSANDPDGDPLGKNWYLDGVAASTAESYTFNAVSGTSGAHNVTVDISDGYGGHVRHVWFVTVDANLVMPFATNGSPVIDYAGFDNNGTVGGGATWMANGGIGGCYKFDGTGYIRVEDSPAIGGDGTWNEITVAFWINITQNQRGTRIVAKTGSNPSGYQVGFQTSATQPYNTLYFGVWCAAGSYYEVSYLNGTQGLGLNVWYYVVCTYKSSDGARALKIYVNGNMVNSNFGSGSICQTGGQALFIGYRNGTNTSFFKGMVDEVSIFPKALTAAQIQQAFNQTKAGFTSLTQSQSTDIGQIYVSAFQLPTLPIATLVLLKAGRKRKRTE